MAKGSRFERDVCRQLSLWWSGGEHDDLFWRTSTSGARATVRGRCGKRTYGQGGDVCATHPDGDPLIKMFTFELKRGYSANTITDLLDKHLLCKQQQWEEWIQQAITSAEQADSVAWMIIARRDQRPALCVLPTFVIEQLRRDHGLFNTCPDPYLQMTVVVRFYDKGKFAEGRRLRLSVLKLDRFLKEVSPDHLRAAQQEE